MPVEGGKLVVLTAAIPVATLSNVSSATSWKTAVVPMSMSSLRPIALTIEVTTQTRAPGLLLVFDGALEGRKDELL